MRIDKEKDNLDSVKQKLMKIYGFTNNIKIYKLLLKPNLEEIDNINLLDNNDRVYLELWIICPPPPQVTAASGVNSYSET